MPRDYDHPDDYDDDYRGPGVLPHRGVMILVFGVLGLMICGWFGIPAYLMGKRDLELIRRGRMDKEAEALTKVGHVLGIVGMILGCLQTLIVGTYFVFIVIMLSR
jgi:hypothetical protein